MTSNSDRHQILQRHRSRILFEYRVICTQLQVSRSPMTLISLRKKNAPLCVSEDLTLQPSRSMATSPQMSTRSNP